MTSVKTQLDSIESAIEDMRNGKVIIVVDDEDRENEGDFICAAECITPDIINFMATKGRGLICTPIAQEIADNLGLLPMVDQNTDLHGTAFTVSIDYKKKNCTTGISAYDRATGIRAMLDAETKPEDFARPGHIFPLIAQKGGVLKRTGHTEAAIDLARLAGYKPAGVLVEILNEDGTMARLPQLLVIAEVLDLKIISIKDLVAWRMKRERLVTKELSFDIETCYGEMRFTAFREKNSGLTHLAISKGSWTKDEAVLTKVHSSNYAGDIINALLVGNKKELSHTLNILGSEEKGVLLYLMNEEEDDELMSILKTIKSQVDRGSSDIKPFPNIAVSKVQRNIGIGAQILNELGIRKLRLLSNNVKRRVGLNGYGIEVVEHVAY